MSKTTDPRADLKVNDSILALADAIKQNAVVDATGVISVPKDFYEKNLPEGISIADVRKLQAHNSELVSAGVIALGELGVPHLKKHKDLTEATIVIDAARDQFSAGLVRLKSQRNPATGETTDVYGSTSARWRTTGTAGSRGSLKASRDYVLGLAAKELKA
jgi:hypothetical protein